MLKVRILFVDQLFSTRACVGFGATPEGPRLARMQASPQWGLLACASQQYEVDLDRIYSTGHSAGGLWTSYLSMHASKWLAATAVMSCGSDAGSYSTPEDEVPVLVIWGGPSDTHGGFNFGDSSRTFSTELQHDGHFVAMCEHSQLHVPPTGVRVSFAMVRGPSSRTSRMSWFVMRTQRTA